MLAVFLDHLFEKDFSLYGRQLAHRNPHELGLDLVVAQGTVAQSRGSPPLGKRLVVEFRGVAARQLCDVLVEWCAHIQVPIGQRALQPFHLAPVDHGHVAPFAFAVHADERLQNEPCFPWTIDNPGVAGRYRLLPLDSGRRLAGNIVGNARDIGHFVDDTA